MGLFGGLFKKKDELFANSAKMSMEEMEEVQISLKDQMDSDTYDSAFNQASRLIPKRQFERAIEKFEVIRDNSTDTYERGSCETQIGVCYFFLGDFEKALDFYTQSFHSGFDKRVNDYNIWEVCEELMKRDRDKAKWSRYYVELIPDGQHAAKAQKNLA